MTLDPIRFVFDISEADHLRYSRLILSGALASSRDGANPVRIRLSDETDWKRTGKVDFVDNAMTARSGTIRVRALVDNKDQLLTPGIFGGRLQLFGGEYDALLIPDSAIISDQARKIVFVVGPGDVVQAKPVTLGTIVDGLRVIRSGLEPTDKVVLDGLANPWSGLAPRSCPRRPRSPPRPGKGPSCVFSHFFIDRPIFASVLSVIIVIVGFIAQRGLPSRSTRDRAPYRQHHRDLPGASAEVIAETVATPIELEVNGVDDMLYIQSQSTGDGRLSINVVFKPGVDIDQAQVLVQNRVAVAQPRLPEDVQRLGIVVRKASPDLMMVVHMVSSPDGSRDQQYISNYATLYVKDVLTRVDGVGNVLVFGGRDYSMRIWLDPARVAARNLTAGEVVLALRAANLQVAAGAVNQAPAVSPGGFTLSVRTLGRLSSPDQFENIVIRAEPDGSVTRLRDIARVELGAQDYTLNAYLNNKTATALGIFSGRDPTRSRPRTPSSRRWSG